MARVEKVPVSSFSPFYGCAIMIMAALVFGGIIAWSAYSLFQQDKAIAVFAENQPQKFAAIDLSPEAKPRWKRSSQTSKQVRWRRSA